MKRALIISSQVAASSVGANASAFCLRRLGVETVVLPTTLLGRHPGWGDPGGALTPHDLLREMWSGISAQNLAFDAVLTGYMGSSETVEFTTHIVRDLKAQNPYLLVVVDPVMGDNGQLYVPEAVASAIRSLLVPLADVLTPNVWEFSYLLDREFRNLDQLKDALHEFSKSTLVTSVRNGNEIGGMLHHAGGLTYWGHEKFERVPHGGGDAVSGTFLAHILRGRDIELAAAQAISSIFAFMQKAFVDDAPELPLTEYQSLLVDAERLKFEEM